MTETLRGKNRDIQTQPNRHTQRSGPREGSELGVTQT